LNAVNKKIATLKQLFGDNRAEWSSDEFKEIFVEPAYHQKLESYRPCILVGGRGTGKTTALQSLKFDSAIERIESQGGHFGDLGYLGVLVRMNKNRVHGFHGSARTQSEWDKIFAHYFNLIVSLELTKMGTFLESKTGQTFPVDSVTRISYDLGVDSADDLSSLGRSIKKAISTLQLFVNNPSSDIEAVISMAESPLRAFVEELKESGLIGQRIIFCCIDEYENLLDYQQGIINTYIKHSSPPLSYKIGVRKNGLRNHQTMDGQDSLRCPDDYAEIEIAEEGFEYFAKAVAEQRLMNASEQGVEVPLNLSDFLIELTIPEEADLLGAKKIATGVLAELKKIDQKYYEFFSSKSNFVIAFLRFWQEKEGRTLQDLAINWLENAELWDTRLGNHGYASLWWISKGKGYRTRKYYCGDRVFLSLASGNIRYFLELIDMAITHEIEALKYDITKTLTISPQSQTYATRDVGKRRLNQLEGLADKGVQLKRLALAIGKVFFEHARSPLEKAPETVSFLLRGKPNDTDKVSELLAEGVAHLAFECTPSTKATSSNEARENEYRLHPIYCGFFEISHRRKRRVLFDSTALMNITTGNPSKAISSMLEEKTQTDLEDLPEQLAFFSSFYNGGNNS
jgi:hypothetical protein